MRRDKTEYAFVVRFHEPPVSSTEREHYFFSIAAILDRFTPSEIGCSLWTLHRAKIRDGNRYEGRRCVVYRVPVHRKPNRERKAEE